MKPADKRILKGYASGDVLVYTREGGKHYISITLPGLSKDDVGTRRKYPIPEAMRVELGRAILEQDWDPNAPVEVAPDQSDGTPRCTEEEESDTWVDVHVPTGAPHRTSG